MDMDIPVAPRGNHLMASLPQGEQAQLLALTETLQLACGNVLYESGERITHLHFPSTAVVFLVCAMENGTTAEAGMVGCEGVVGIDALLGAETAAQRAVAQVAGRSHRIAVAPARELFRRGGAFQRAVLLHTQALMAQIAQTAACNALHSMEKRLCRWLLLMRDRMECDEIRMTHDMIAHLLGVRREGVTVAARRLQAMGLIRYARGHILLGDRRAIEAGACECYRAVAGWPASSVLGGATRLGSARLRPNAAQ